MNEEKLNKLGEIFAESDKRMFINRIVRTTVLAGLLLIAWFAGSLYGHNLTVEMQRDREAMAIEHLAQVVKETAHTHIVQGVQK
jgi:hypothetical protein